MISDQVWAALNTVCHGPEPAVVVAALETGRWRCGGCGLPGADADSSAVLVLHHSITYRPESGRWSGATIDQPPDRGVWTLVAWELRRYHPACVTAPVMEATTATGPGRRAGDPARLYPPAPDRPAGADLFWWTRLPAAPGVPVMIWQPELAQPIVAATADLYPVGDAHLQRIARLGGQWSTHRQLTAAAADRSWCPPMPGRCRAHVGDGAISVLDSSIEESHADGPLVVQASVPDGWAAAAREAGTVVLLGLAGGTLPDDTPTAALWHDPRLRSAIDGPTPHMLPPPDVPEIGLDLAELDLPARPGAVVADFACPPVETRARILALRVEAARTAGA